jgi:hypothetical protein
MFCNSYPRINIAFSVMKCDTDVTSVGLIYEKIKSRLNSGNTCNLSVQNLLSSRLLSKNLNIKIYKTVVSYGMKLCL